jgi:hypothetical protein
LDTRTLYSKIRTVEILTTKKYLVSLRTVVYTDVVISAESDRDANVASRNIDFQDYPMLNFTSEVLEVSRYGEGHED